MLELGLYSGFSGNIWLGLAVELGLPFKALPAVVERLDLPLEVMRESHGSELLDTRLTHDISGTPNDMLYRVERSGFSRRIVTAAKAMIVTRYLADVYADPLATEQRGVDFADTLFDLVAAAVAHDFLGWPVVRLTRKVEMGAPSPPSVLHLSRSLPTRSCHGGAELLTPSGATILVQSYARPSANALSTTPIHKREAKVLSPFAIRLGLPPVTASLVQRADDQTSAMGGLDDEAYLRAVLSGRMAEVVSEPRVYERFCRAVGRPDLVNNVVSRTAISEARTLGAAVASALGTDAADSERLSDPDPPEG